MVNRHSHHWPKIPLDVLTIATPHDKSFSYDRAYIILAEQEDLDQAATADIIERLLVRGYLYEVDDELRLTEWSQANE